MKRKILYLINPVSGTKRKPAIKAAIEKRNSAAAIDFEITQTRSDGNYTELHDHILAQKITDVVVCGGDGSVSTVSSFLLDLNVAIGIIPTGSGNGLALAAGIPYSTGGALDVIFKGYSSFIDGFLINDKFSCMMCGMGIDAEVAHDFALSRIRGLLTYIKLSAIHYFKARPYSFTIETSDRTLNVEAFFVTIANSNQFGNYVTIAPRASLTDGLFDVVIVKKMNKLMLPFALMHQIAGANPLTEFINYRDNKNIIYFQASEAVITNNQEAPLHVDGEPQPFTGKIKLKIMPNAFRLLQPSL